MGFLNRIRSLRGIFNNGTGISPVGQMSGSYDFITYRVGGDVPDVTVNLDDLDGINDAYIRCSTLGTIVNRNAMALVNGKWWVVDRKDNEVIGKYAGIASLLKNPNPLQTWSEFIVQMDVYRQVYGEVFVYAVVPDGFSIQEASALWVINPCYIDIELTGKMYMQADVDDIIVNYYLNAGGYRNLLDKSCILYMRDLNQNLNMAPDNIRGMSRMVSVRNSIRNIIQAEEAVYSLNKDRGAQGILSNEAKDVTGTVPMDDKEKEDVQNKLNGRYGLKENQWKVIVTDASMKWQQMSFNVKDLMLFEGIENNIKRISEAYDYPYELMADGNVTYANKIEAKRYHYQNNIIPISKIYAEKFTEFFQLKRDSFYVDFSEVECLRDSEAQKADMLHKLNQAYKIAKDAGIISMAEWRLAIGLDEEVYKPDKVTNNDETGENTGEEAGQ